MSTKIIIAHRGASGEAPENTLSSISRALALKSDFIEIDIHLTKDGVPVLSHDPTLSRITGRKEASHLHKLTLEEIKRVDAGSHFHESFRGEPIPTLDEVLRLNWGGTGLMIELKGGHSRPEKLVEAVCSVLQSAEKLPSRLVLGSFSLPIVGLLASRKMKSSFPYEVIGIAEKLSMLEAFAEHGIKHLALWHRLLSKETMGVLVPQNIEVWAFTVNRTKLADQLISLSVNGIITNHPRSMLENGNFVLH